MTDMYVAIIGPTNHVEGVAVVPDDTELDESGYGFAEGAIAAVDITELDPRPAVGWIYDDGEFTPPADPTIPLPQQAVILMMSGLTITSTGTPALNGTYAVDPGTQLFVMAESISLLRNDLFIGGTSTVEWPDITGTVHTFSIAAWNDFSDALALFVAGCVRVIQGRSMSLPDNTITIA